MIYYPEYDSFVFETDDPIFDEGIRNGTAEPYPLHLAIVKRYLDMFPTRNRCFVDVGAHIGTTAAPYSRLFSTVHAYEPSSASYSFLVKNIKGNDLKNCTAYNIGLYSHTCTGVMKYHGGGNSGCFAFEPAEVGDVNCIRLDDQNHEFVDFLKIDTEGSELFVLKGAEATLRKWKPLVQFETNELSQRLYGISTQKSIDYLKSLGYVEFDTSDPNNIFLYVPRMEKRIFCFWTGNNPMSENRLRCLASILETTGVSVSFVTPTNLSSYILQAHPLHPGFEHLSAVHKADYLRTYFMHFYGGGYTDIKRQTGSWKPFFDTLETSDAYIIGYTESGPGDIACREVEHMWRELVGNCSYICKPNTPFTYDWYTSMIKLMDQKLTFLRMYPATHPRDAKEYSNYPIEWNELLGRIFHKVCSEYRSKLLRGLPHPIFGGYM